MAKLTWHGHATCSLETDDGVHLVIDPFFGDNPKCDVSVDEVEADFILSSGQRFHHAGDTALLTDMQLLKGRVDVAMLPIGDRYTMGPADAVRAVELIEPEVVIPMHYGTWPPIEQDAGAFEAAVGTRARVEIMQPGDTYEL